MFELKSASHITNDHRTIGLKAEVLEPLKVPDISAMWYFLYTGGGTTFPQETFGWFYGYYRRSVEHTRHSLVQSPYSCALLC